MEIETYEIEEVVDGERGTTPEIEEEAKALIQELELTGQEELLVQNDDGEEKRIPYPKLKAAEAAVYSVVFPKKVSAEAYNAGIIPVRVMQVIKHAREFFVRVEIWHQKVHDPDPILVGKRDKNSDDLFLLARWSEDALVPFKVLEERAREILRKDWKAAAEETKAHIDRWLDKLEANLTRQLHGDHVSVPYFYG